jgi:DNA recombination protein Rad52
MINDAQRKLLSDKLDASHVKPPSANGPKGDYLEGWHVIAEANRIFGFDGWSYDIYTLTQCHEAFKNEKGNWVVSYIARVKVNALEVTREDVGYGSGYARNPGDAHESAVKEAVTDALKRALRTFGNPFGLALYDKTRANVEATPEPKPAIYNSLVAELRKAVVAADVGRMWRDQEFIDLRKSMPEEWQAKLQEEATKIGNELKAKEAKKDTVKDIQDAFPGSTVRDERITDISGRELDPLEAAE